jgi:hypothetical protein
MKRYWKTITLCLVAIVVIGTFYIQTSIAEENTKFEFEKISGHQDEVNNLSLYATYGVGNQLQSLQISSKGTTLFENQGLIQEFTMNNNGPLHHLVREHKSFMRGKDLLGNNLYEDENLIVYANIKRENGFAVIHDTPADIKVDIEVLDKKSYKTASTEVHIPRKEHYGWMDVVDVQVFADELKVFTRGYRTQGGSDLSVYTIELEGLKLINNERIASAPIVKNGWSELRIINQFYSTKPEKYLLIKIDSFKDQQVEGKVVQTEPKSAGNNEIIVYNMEKNLPKKVTIPEDLSLDNTATIVDSTIFIASPSDNGLEVSQYDIEKEEWGQNLSFDFLDTKAGADDSFIKLLEGKVYQFVSNKNGHFIFIGNLTTGETLYEGKINVLNPSDDQKNSRLMVHEIEYIQ